MVAPLLQAWMTNPGALMQTVVRSRSVFQELISFGKVKQSQQILGKLTQIPTAMTITK